MPVPIFCREMRIMTVTGIASHNINKGLLCASVTVMQKFFDALNVRIFRDAASTPISTPNGSTTDARDH